MVAVECCTVSFRSDRPRKADIIAMVLFGDGAAAACLAAGEGAVTLGNGVERSWPDTLDIMGWDMDDHGLGVVFDRAVPDFAIERMGGACAEALGACGLAAVDRWVCHPGGAKVVLALEGALGLPEGALGAEREVLRVAGNMSAPTVLFVLEHVLAEGARGRMMAVALGPGFTASFLPLAVG